MRPDIDFLVQMEHLKDIQRVAEQDRLVRLALAGNEKPGRDYRKILSWLWEQLVTLGCYLQGLIGQWSHTPAEPPVTRPCMEQD